MKSLKKLSLKVGTIICAIAFGVFINFDGRIDEKMSINLLTIQGQIAQGEEGGGSNPCYYESQSGGNTDTTKCVGCSEWNDRKKLKQRSSCS